VVENLRRNAAAAQALICRALPRIPATPDWPCHRALDNAILTPRELWPPATVRRLRVILGRLLEPAARTPRRKKAARRD
jgi:5'-methylthioadenosine phosphorylase